MRGSAAGHTEIHCNRMEALLGVAEDPDHRFLLFLVETDLGEEMIRVPAVFEAKVKWNLEEVEDPFKEVWCEDNMVDIRRQVEEEQVAIQKFGGRLAVASLGAVPKELGSSKVRIIHDATHEGMINHRIRVRDRMRFPGVDDLEAMVRQMKADHRRSGCS